MEINITSIVKCTRKYVFVACKQFHFVIIEEALIFEFSLKRLFVSVLFIIIITILYTPKMVFGRVVLYLINQSYSPTDETLKLSLDTHKSTQLCLSSLL